MKNLQKVLLVEDNRPDIWLITKLFKQCGQSLEYAMDGPTGLNMIMANRYDLVLLDLNLPGLSGFEVLSALRSVGDLTPVVVLTSSEREADIVKAYETGASSYTVKPTDHDSFLALVKAISQFWRWNLPAPKTRTR